MADARYDVAILGCGMSGLAAGIRLAHFGRRVCIFERHNAPGGLNGFYSIAGRKHDVGLHAVTNWSAPGGRGTPLAKLLRQLRLDREELDLCPQFGSRIAFPGVDLRFTNDPAVLESEVAARFPAQIDGFRALQAEVRAFSETTLDTPETSARAHVRRHLTDPLLEDMLFCPVLYYGSATEHDLPWWSFVVLYRSLLLEGFWRPLEGVRRIIRVLLAKYRAAGGERRMKCGVARIVAEGGRAARLVLDSGREVVADHVISSIGLPETLQLCGEGVPRPPAPVGRLSFVETISVLREPPAVLGWGGDTVVFFNDRPRFAYESAADLVDPRSGVVCLPNNYDYGPGRALPEGWFRVTCLGSHARWTALPEEEYQARKREWFPRVQAAAMRFLPPLDPARLAAETVATDMFTPRTIARYTGHLGGAVYGSAEKVRTGRTHLSNLYLCGTDQGYLGIIGALMSGTLMANRHVLQAG